jgi:hypothetical protein
MVFIIRIITVVFAPTKEHFEEPISFIKLLLKSCLKFVKCKYLPINLVNFDPLLKKAYYLLNHRFPPHLQRVPPQCRLNLLLEDLRILPAYFQYWLMYNMNNYVIPCILLSELIDLFK